MTQGSQLRDIYITALEDKMQQHPVVELDQAIIDANPLLQQMVTAAASSPDLTNTLENFTVEVGLNGEKPKFWALHVFARFLDGESTKSKRRDAVSQEKVAKRYGQFVDLYQKRAFSKNPSYNSGKTPDSILQQTPAKVAAVQAPEKEPVSA